MLLPGSQISMLLHGSQISITSGWISDLKQQILEREGCFALALGQTRIVWLKGVRSCWAAFALPLTAELMDTPMLTPSAMPLLTQSSGRFAREIWAYIFLIQIRSGAVPTVYTSSLA